MLLATRSGRKLAAFGNPSSFSETQEMACDAAVEVTASYVFRGGCMFFFSSVPPVSYGIHTEILFDYSVPIQALIKAHTLLAHVAIM